MIITAPIAIRRLKKLLCTCFAQACWDTLIPSRRRGASIYEGTILALATLPKDFSMEIVILRCWNIWIQMNGKGFKKYNSNNPELAICTQGRYSYAQDENEGQTCYSIPRVVNRQFLIILMIPRA